MTLRHASGTDIARQGIGGHHGRRRAEFLPTTDLQGWVGHDTPVAAFEAWKTRYHADPKVFSFDLQGYGTLMFPQRNIYCLAGFSDKTIETLKLLDEDAFALIRQIEAVDL